jgi:hypothetical protein
MLFNNKYGRIIYSNSEFEIVFSKFLDEYEYMLNSSESMLNFETWLSK